MQVSKLELEQVVGLGDPGPQVLGMSPTDDSVVAYAVGSYVVLYDWRRKRTLKALRSRTSNLQVACCCWSLSSKYLASGEKGCPASVLLWDVAAGTCLQEFKGHRNSITAVAVAGDDKLLTSVSAGQLCVWEVATGQLLAKQALQGRPSAVAFTEDSTHVLMTGKRLFKIWQLPVSSNGSARNPAKASSGSSAMTERPAQLKEYKGDNFVDLRTAAAPANQQPGTNGLYALTSSGFLLMLRPTGRTLDKAIDLQVDAAHALGVCTSLVAACCSAGIVRLFACRTLAFSGTLPRILPKVAESGSRFGAAGGVSEDLFPPALGCSFSSNEQQIAVVYGDHNIIMWDIRNPAQATHLTKLAAHNSAIWGVVPLRPDPALAHALAVRGSRCVTCGADGMVRVWKLDSNQASDGTASRSLAGAIPVGVQAGIAAIDGQAAGAGQLLRCLAVSPDTRHLAVGDQLGNIRAYDLTSYELVACQEAHDGEVLSLDYALLADGRCVLASGSRDMLVHLYDATGGYQLLETFDDHAAAVTAVKLASEGTCLISCSADGNIKFRILGDSNGGVSQVYAEQQLPSTILYSLALDPLGSVVTSVSQDGWLRRWEVATGQLKQQLAPEAGAGEPINVSVDPGGVTAISSHSDGAVRLYNLATGQLMWRAWGHSDMVAGACVTPDMQHLVSVGGDGCMIVWRLPAALVASIATAAAQVAQALAHSDGAVHPHAAGVRGAATAHAGAAARGVWAATDQASVHTPGPASTSAAEADAGAGADMPTWLRRAREGKTLLSTAKLPRWARALTNPSVDDTIRSTSAAAAETLKPSAAVPPNSKWARQLGEQLVVHNEHGTPIVFRRQADGHYTRDGAESDTCSSPATPLSEQPTPLSSVSRLAPAAAAQAAANGTWRLLESEEDTLVVYDGEVYESTVLEPEEQEVAAAAEGAAGEPSSSRGPEGVVNQEDGSQWPDDVPPATKSEEPVIRQNLFLQHFQTLNSDGQLQPAAGSATTATGPLRGSLARLDERRSSLSTRFIEERNSWIRSSQQGLGAAAAAVPAPAAATASSDVAAPVAGATAAAPPRGPRRRWREGKMDDELAKMRDRLAGLQEVYQQQLAGRSGGRQASGGLPDGAAAAPEEEQAAGSPPVAAPVAAAGGWVPPLPPGPPPAAALTRAAAEAAATGTAVGAGISSPADRTSSPAAGAPPPGATPPTPLPFAQPPAPPSAPPAHAPAAAPTPPAAPAAAGAVYHQGSTTPDPHGPSAAAAPKEAVSVALPGPGVTAGTGPDGSSTWTVCWDGAATPSPGPALVPPGLPGSGVMMQNPCYGMTPGSAPAMTGPVDFATTPFQFGAPPAGVTSPNLWAKPADAATAAVAATTTPASAGASPPAAAAASPAEDLLRTPPRRPAAAAAFEGQTPPPAVGAGALPLSPVMLADSSPATATPSTSAGTGDESISKRKTWGRLSRTDSGTASLTATPSSPRTGVLGLLQRMVAFPGRTKSLDKQGSNASILAGLDKQGSGAAALADASSIGSPACAGSSSGGSLAPKWGSRDGSAAAAGAKSPLMASIRSHAVHSGAPEGGVVGAEDVELELESSTAAIPTPPTSRLAQTTSAAEPPWRTAAAGSPEPAAAAEDGSSSCLAAIEELTQCIADLHLKGEQLARQLQRQVTPAPSTPASVAGSDTTSSAAALQRAKLQQQLLAGAAKLQQVAMQLGPSDLIPTGHPGQPGSPGSPYWLSSQGQPTWCSPGSLVGTMQTPGSGGLQGGVPGSPGGSIGSLAAADLENLTARICQQYTDMLMKKLGEKTRRDGSECPS